MKIYININIYPKVSGGLNNIGNIPGICSKTWKTHGNIMEFCQSGNGGTLN